MTSCGRLPSSMTPMPEPDKRDTGTLISWSPQRGFGFVRREHGADVFVSAKDVLHSGVDRDLQVGMRLSFVAQRDYQADRKERAIKIAIVGERPW